MKRRGVFMLVWCKNKVKPAGEVYAKQSCSSTGDMFTPSYPPEDFINDIK